MATVRDTSLRTQLPWRVLEGFGGAVRSASRYVEPATADELVDIIARTRHEGLSVTFRGAGRSYGDAALNAGGVVVDLCRLNRVHEWSPSTGIINAEPGLTIEGLWRRTIADGYWPAVVPGTMRPTLGGCVSMNVHGKNNYRAGVFGDHVLDFDLVTPSGQRLFCSRSENPDVFFGTIGGLGLLGAVTRVRLRLKRVGSGYLRVEPLMAGTLDGLLDQFEESLPHHDYTVGWLDCTARGAALGRGVIHRARYVAAEEVPDVEDSFRVERQSLPSSILGLPKSQLWKLMRPMTFDAGVRFVNALKYQATRWEKGHAYLQTHVAFAFLLDYVPNWRLAYGPGGFIQYQSFVPYESARRTLPALLALCRERRIPPYLGVLKRHRPDEFLLSHAVDGWSLALDFRVTAGTRDALWRLTDELTARVLDVGGRFYFAKDAVLRPADVERAFGVERVQRFLALKERLDPEGVLTSDLWRRVVQTGARTTTNRA